MIHKNCGCNCGIVLNNYILVSVNNIFSGGQFYSKILDLYKKRGHDIIESDIEFACGKCGIIDKSEVYNSCDYCGNNLPIDKLYFSIKKNGVFCKHCSEDIKEVDKESLLEKLLSHGIVLP